MVSNAFPVEIQISCILSCDSLWRYVMMNGRRIPKFESKRRYFVSSPSLSARSSSIFTDEGCQLVRPRGVRSRIASSRVQIA